MFLVFVSQRRGAPQLLAKPQRLLCWHSLCADGIGTSRQQAAAWVVRNIPSDLAHRISSKLIRRSTVEEWMGQYGATLQVRRELKSIVRLDRLVEFLRSGYRSRRIDGSFGQLACLRMMYFGQKCLVAGNTVPFFELFALFREEWEAPVQDGQVRRDVKQLAARYRVLASIRFDILLSAAA